MTNLLASVISALISIESGGDVNAHNPSGAVGILQLKPVAVEEANRIIGYSRWDNEDRLDEWESIQMCFETLKFHYERGVKDPVELGCRWYYPYAPDRVPSSYRNKLQSHLTKHSKIDSIIAQRKTMTNTDIKQCANQVEAKFIVDKKPYEYTCPKCGSSDVMLTHFEKGEKIEHGIFDKSKTTKHIKEQSPFESKVVLECIKHDCRICQYWWSTDPITTEDKIRNV